ncbi:hypothetical protein FRC00_004449 [Tulasnella sp. 408]|nr:hypothetical protein FRC00_004449 [Tulasnella sp. 408]
MADLFSLHLSGNASKCFENLDDKTQQDWNLLKRAFIEKYGDAKPKVAAAVTSNPKPPPAASTSLPNAKVDDKAKSISDPLLPARIAIASWSSPALSSAIRFPKSIDEWLREARQRNSKLSEKSGIVYWHLVERSQWVPENLIPISLESGVTM